MIVHIIYFLALWYFSIRESALIASSPYEVWNSGRRLCTFEEDDMFIILNRNMALASSVEELH